MLVAPLDTARSPVYNLGVVALQDAEKVYVRLPNWVGDVVLATPFLRALRAAAPRAQVIAHGKPFQLAIIEGEGLFDRALPLERRGLLGPLREGRRLREAVGVPDVAFLLPNSVSSALIAWTSGAPARVGYRLNGRGPLLTHALAVRREGLFRPVPMVDYYLAQLQHLGADTSAVARRPVLTPSAEARQWAEEFLTRQRLNARGQRLWALNIGGSWETKQWIPEQAGALVRLLRREGIAPLLLRGPDEGALAERVCAAAGERVPGADEVVRLGELTAVLERCELLVTTDSGPRHFGIAAGVPVLVLIGSTHPGYTAVDYPALRLVSEQVSCWPCHLKVCPLDFRCMRRLTADRVAAAGERLVRDVAARAEGTG